MDFDDLINKRYSVRNYRPDKPDQATLQKVLDAGRMAPSAVNRQPWIFIVVEESSLLKQLHEAYPRPWFSGAPIVLVLCADHQESWKRPGDLKDHADIDLAIATDHITLKAAELGLGTCWVCNFNPLMVSKALHLPAHIEPVVLLPIGWPLKASAPTKSRKPLSSIIRFNGY